MNTEGHYLSQVSLEFHDSKKIIFRATMILAEIVEESFKISIKREK